MSDVMNGIFDDVPAENFGNLPPLPAGYVVVLSDNDEMYYWTIRGSDIEGWGGWDRYAARRAALQHASVKSTEGNDDD